MTIVPNLDTLPTPTAVSTYAGIPPKFFTLNLQIQSPSLFLGIICGIANNLLLAAALETMHPSDS